MNSACRRCRSSRSSAVSSVSGASCAVSSSAPAAFKISSTWASGSACSDASESSGVESGASCSRSLPVSGSRRRLSVKRMGSCSSLLGWSVIMLSLKRKRRGRPETGRPRSCNDSVNAQRLLLIVFVDDFSINDVFVLIGGLSLCSVLFGLGVQGFANLGLRLLQFFKCSLDFVVVILFFKGCLEGVDVGLDLSFDVLWQFFVVFFEQLSDRVGGGFSGVPGFSGLAALLILFGVGFGIFDHAVDVFIRQRGATGNGHRLLGAGGTVLGGHVDDAVGVNVEGDLNLWHSAWCRCNTGQLEVAQWFIIRGEFTFTLEHLNIHGRLVVVGGGECFGTFGWDSRVAFDQLGHHTALGFDTQ